MVKGKKLKRAPAVLSFQELYILFDALSDIGVERERVSPATPTQFPLESSQISGRLEQTNNCLARVSHNQCMVSENATDLNEAAYQEWNFWFSTTHHGKARNSHYGYSLV